MTILTKNEVDWVFVGMMALSDIARDADDFSYSKPIARDSVLMLVKQAKDIVQSLESICMGFGNDIELPDSGHEDAPGFPVRMASVLKEMRSQDKWEEEIAGKDLSTKIFP